MALNIQFSQTESKVKSFFEIDKAFNFEGEEYHIVLAEKPRAIKGESKTDLYVLAKSSNGKKELELKISIKQINADFLENKISLERAKEILGDNAQTIIEDAISTIANRFKKLIHLEQEGRTDAGSIKLGWKFELMNKPSGFLSGQIPLSNIQKLEVYSGSGNQTKKHCKVGGKVTPHSGVANYLLNFNNDLKSLKNVVDALIPLNAENIDQLPDIYFACKALNYRIHKNKWDGNRPLSVYVNWKVENGLLIGDLVFNNVLVVKGNEIGVEVRKILQSIGIEADNFEAIKNFIKDRSIIYPDE